MLRQAQHDNSIENSILHQIVLRKSKIINSKRFPVRATNNLLGKKRSMF